MDFSGDATARNVNDQYLFGPAFLVNPVYEYNARSRQVYLPARHALVRLLFRRVHEGGRKVEAAAPLARMPLFVKAGSIVPIGPEVQHTDEKPQAPITLYVYRGADGSFDLYEDDGLTTAMRKASSRAFDSLRRRSRHVEHSRPRGRFPGMVATRTFNVRWIAPGTAGAPAIRRHT